LFWPTLALAQDPPPIEETPTVEDQPQAPDQVNVQPQAQDNEIDMRLTSILEATEWFVNPEVEVQEGVVFLDGRTPKEEYREWAGNLARNTQDVVAVVNRLEIIPRSAWDFSPAFTELQTLWRRAIQAIPLFIFGAVVLFLAWWVAQYAAQLSEHVLANRLGSPLLTAIVSRTIAVPVFLLGLYLVLQLAGLTQLALTLLGGTGLVGIIIGFAFRDIAENFLASLLLSIRQPFRSKDLIEVAGHTGIVQQMNTRSTILMTLDGNHVQIPNATVFKNIITNYTANPNRRADFVVGVGYTDAISYAQELVTQVLSDHPAVLKTPEPLVLVEELGAATINLRIYFWYDAGQYAPGKVKSSLIRLTKRALEDAGVSMPDEAREIIFPEGVPLVSLPQSTGLPPQAADKTKLPPPRPAAVLSASPELVSNAAEGNLRSDDEEIQAQAKQARNPEAGENLLEEE
jgi:small conductance mechanosensitive channel